MTQYPQSGIMQQPGSHYIQQQQAQQMSPQALMAARSSMMFSQQQHAMHTGTGTSGLHMLQTYNSNAAASGAHLGGGFPDFGRKQDIGASSTGGGGSSGGDGGETLYLKSPDKGN